MMQTLGYQAILVNFSKTRNSRNSLSAGSVLDYRSARKALRLLCLLALPTLAATPESPVVDDYFGTKVTDRKLLFWLAHVLTLRGCLARRNRGQPERGW